MKNCTTFEALLKPLTKDLIEESVRRFKADYRCKRFKTWDHLQAMIYTQVHELKSLRDIEIALDSPKQQLIKGIHCSSVSRSTLSDANARRPAECFLWIAEQLMGLLPRKPRKELTKVVKKLDSSPIQLKGQGYEWTLTTKTPRCQGLKLHIEYEGEMPSRAQISVANVDDCRIGQRWPIESNTIYVFDKGYYDFNWWWRIEQKRSFFVTRLKYNAGVKVTGRLSVGNGMILEDSVIEFKYKHPRGGKRNAYTKPLRKVVIKREDKERPLMLVTNLLDVPAATIGELYKERWEIELFFKWIKQHLRIKTFLGRSENAVKLQIAVALIVYLLIGLLKILSNDKRSLHQLLIWIRHHVHTKPIIYGLIKLPNYSFTTIDGCKYSQGIL